MPIHHQLGEGPHPLLVSREVLALAGQGWTTSWHEGTGKNE